MPLKTPEARRQYYRDWRNANLELARSLERRWLDANPEYKRNHRRANPDNYRAAFRRWHKANPAKAKAHRRRIIKQQPIWAEADLMNAFYNARPEGHAVDHIVPIKGVTAEGHRISGLHVLANLQYLTSLENGQKWNRMRPEDQALCERVAPC